MVRNDTVVLPLIHFGISLKNLSILPFLQEDMNFTRLRVENVFGELAEQDVC